MEATPLRLVQINSLFPLHHLHLLIASSISSACIYQFPLISYTHVSVHVQSTSLQIQDCTIPS